MTGNGHVRFGGGLSQKYCPDDGRQLGGSLPNLRQAVKAAGDRLTEATTDATKGFLGPKPDIDWQDPAARKAHLGELVAAARMLVAEASAVDDPGFAEATALLAQVVSQDTEVDEAGEAKIRQGVAKDRIISTSDPEMRHGRKSASRKFDGYKMDVMTEEHTELVLGVEIRSGNAGDGEGAAPLLEQVQTIEGIEVEQLLGDMAYSDGDTRVAVEELGAELVAKVPPVSNRGTVSQDRLRHRPGGDHGHLPGRGHHRRCPPGQGSQGAALHDVRLPGRDLRLLCAAGVLHQGQARQPDGCRRRARSPHSGGPAGPERPCDQGSAAPALQGGAQDRPPPGSGHGRGPLPGKAQDKAPGAPRRHRGQLPAAARPRRVRHRPRDGPGSLK